MASQDPDIDRLSAAVRQVLPSVRADLERLVRIPSVSADPAAAPHLAASAGEVAALLRAAGLPEVEVVSAGGSRPAVLGHRAARLPESFVAVVASTTPCGVVANGPIRRWWPAVRCWR